MTSSFCPFFRWVWTPYQFWIRKKCNLRQGTLHTGLYSGCTKAAYRAALRLHRAALGCTADWQIECAIYVQQVWKDPNFTRQKCRWIAALTRFPLIVHRAELHTDGFHEFLYIEFKFEFLHFPVILGFCHGPIEQRNFFYFSSSYLLLTHVIFSDIWIKGQFHLDS